MNPKKIIPFTVLIILIIFGCTDSPTNSENNLNFTDLSGIYFGLETPGLNPTVFRPFEFDETIYEGSYNFSQDGLECIFVRQSKDYTKSDLMFTKVIDGNWLVPDTLSVSLEYNDYIPVISPDGNRLFFSSNRPLPSGYYAAPIWYITKSNGEWGQAEFTGLNGAYTSSTTDGTIYYCDWINGCATIIKSEYSNGEYSQGEIVPAPIYSEQYNDMHPFIAPDESYLIFDSENRPRINDCGLFISFKLLDGNWSDPQNMGEYITQKNAGLVQVSLDGNYLFYNDWYGDTYWVDADIIDEYRTTNDDSNTVSDFDGNVYSTVKIGDQWWMAENLQTTHTSDGTPLNSVFTYDDNENYIAEYGRLYTWQTALNASPPGWHLPSDEEWDVLINTVGSNPADKLRNGGSTGFNAKLGGVRFSSGEYGYLGAIGVYWTSNQSDATHGTVKLFADEESNVITNNTPIAGAKSVRFIKD